MNPQVYLTHCQSELSSENSYKLLCNLNLSLSAIIKIVGLTDSFPLLLTARKSLTESEKAAFDRDLHLFAIHCASECLGLVDQNLRSEKLIDLTQAELASLGSIPPEEGFKKVGGPVAIDNASTHAISVIDFALVKNPLDAVRGTTLRAIKCYSMYASDKPNIAVLYEKKHEQLKELFISMLENKAPWQKYVPAAICSFEGGLQARTDNEELRRPSRYMKIVSTFDQVHNYREGTRSVVRVSPMGVAF